MDKTSYPSDFSDIATLTTNTSPGTIPPVEGFPSQDTASDYPSTTYRVSVDMICTGSQIETVTGALAAAGTCINIKIDRRQ
jgi:hypothetical protein